MADLATLQIKVDASGAIHVVDGFGNAVESAAKKANALERSAKVAGLAIGTTLVAGLALAVKETADAQREQAQLAAALRSTAGASGQTITSLNNQAAALRTLTAATGGEIAAAQALLLTFTKIGGDVFPKATAMTLDMAQALGTDARSAAMQLGKALNDPILGVTALGRAGVQFSADQKAMITTLVETNQLAEAQKIILAELETQVGGSAAAYRNTLGGALTALRESFVEMFEVTGPGMRNLVDDINIFADALITIPTRIELLKERLKNLFLQPRGAQAIVDRLNNVGPTPALEKNLENIVALERLLAEQQESVVSAAAARLRARGRGGSLTPYVPVAPSDGSLTPLVPGAPSVSEPATVSAVTQLSAALERLRSTITSPRTTTVSTAGLGAMAAQGQANIAQQVIATQAKMEMEARATTLLAEHNLRENLQMELAKNFRENMQRAFGDVLTEFVTKGKVSIGGLFDSLKQIGGSMVGQVIGKGLSGLFGALKMTPFGSILAGGALALVGNLFGRRRRPSAGQDGNEQARFEAGEAARREREQEMRDFVAGRNGGRGGVIQSVGQVLQETSASRMIGELVAIRVATTRTADAVAGGTLTGGAGTTVNVTVQGGAAGNLNGVAEQVADAVDRLLGTRVQGLRLTSGSAVTI